MATTIMTNERVSQTIDGNAFIKNKHKLNIISQTQTLDYMLTISGYI